MPRPASADPTQLPPTAPDWRMSDPGPLPPPPRRPRWLLFLLGGLGLCLLICVLFYVWTQTAGREVVGEFFATAEAMLTATAEVGTP